MFGNQQRSRNGLKYEKKNEKQQQQKKTPIKSNLHSRIKLTHTRFQLDKNMCYILLFGV